MKDIPQAIFGKLQIGLPEEIEKTDQGVVATFSSILNASTFAVALEQYSVPLAKMRCRNSFSGDAKCIISQDSFNLLCNKLGLGDNMFDSLPGMWQHLAQNQTTGLNQSLG